MMTRTLALGAAIIVTSITLAPALTAAPETDQARITYSDLDLSTNEGSEAFVQGRRGG